jgi:hypothetical protein
VQKSDERELRARFRDQHGVVSRSELRRLGVGRALERAKVASGEWVRVGRNVLRLSTAPTTDEQALMAACLEAGPSAVASHQSAAWMWGLLPPPQRHAVIASRNANVPPKWMDFHRPVDYPTHVVTRKGIACTDPLRTLFDLAGVAGAEVLDEAVDRALASRLVSVEGLQAELVRLARQGRRGAGGLREALNRRGWNGAPAPSVLESMVLRLLREGGIEPLGTEVKMGPRGRYKVDTRVTPRLVLEVDGFAFHHSPEQKAEDERRRNRSTSKA